MKGKKKQNILSVFTFLLIIVGISGLLSAAAIAGVLPGSQSSVHSPTATYQGYFAVSYQGIYHYVVAVPFCAVLICPASETVFYLNTRNGTIRLIFYCGAFSIDYCYSATQLPFGDGTCLYVKGTLLQPSKWPSDKFSPPMHFNGDLYVFENETLPAASCS
jgi:hypothetical protein